MDGDFPAHELPPPGGGIQLQVSLVLELETTLGDMVDTLMTGVTMAAFRTAPQTPAPWMWSCP